MPYNSQAYTKLSCLKKANSIKKKNKERAAESLKNYGMLIQQWKAIPYVRDAGASWAEPLRRQGIAWF